jgi:hypothetical protein
MNEFDQKERKAKEIALSAAISMKPSYTYNFNQPTVAGPPKYDVVAEAQKIYEWLIKE